MPPRRSWSTTRNCRSYLHADDALAPGAPAVWDEVPDNMPVETWFGDREATDKAFAAADHIVEDGFPHRPRHRRCRSSRAPRGAIRCRDRPLYAACRLRRRGAPEARAIATVLGIKPDDLRVLSYDVGGNFGTRNRVFVEFGLVLWAARKLGRPVKFTATRSEAFLSDYQGRDLVTKVELALAQGRHASSACAQPTSAMSARAACRSRR